MTYFTSRILTFIIFFNRVMPSLYSCWTPSCILYIDILLIIHWSGTHKRNITFVILTARQAAEVPAHQSSKTSTSITSSITRTCYNECGGVSEANAECTLAFSRKSQREQWRTKHIPLPVNICWLCDQEKKLHRRRISASIWEIYQVCW